MKTAVKEYYIASVQCYQVKYYDGTVAVEENDIAWLGESDGYAACTRDKSSAKHFKKLTDITPVGWDGKPWYFRLKPGTLKVYHVKEVITHEIIEDEVHLGGIEVHLGGIEVH